jgi:hypothetical protein
MSNSVRQVVKCENCIKDIEITSPPSREQYRNGRIELKDGWVLLDRPAGASSHSAKIDGYFCDLNCLIAHIKGLRGQP